MNRIAYAQCREQLDGSWAPDSSWQCQQPVGTALDPSNSTTPSTEDNSSGSGAGTVAVKEDVASSNTESASSDESSDSSNSQAATTGDCTSTSAPGGWDGVASTSVSLWG